jgi:MraZ protein
MFVGSYRHRLDAKGRVSVPAQFRRELPEGSVVAIGPEGRLMIWPSDEWRALEQRYRRTSDTGAEERRLIRQLFGSARLFELDAQGRMLLAPEHRTFAQVRDTVVFTGVGNAVEIVGEEVWDADTGQLDAAAFTELHDLVNQRGSPAPPSAA